MMADLHMLFAWRPAWRHRVTRSWLPETHYLWCAVRQQCPRSRNCGLGARRPTGV